MTESDGGPTDKFDSDHGAGSVIAEAAPSPRRPVWSRWKPALLWLWRGSPEILALLLFPVVIRYASVELLAHFPYPSQIGSEISNFYSPENFALGLEFAYYFFLPLILLAMTRINRAGYLALAWIWVAAPMVYMAFKITLPALNEIKDEVRALGPAFQTLLPRPWFPLTVQLTGALIASPWPIIFLSGVFSARRNFRLWKFALGFLSAALFMNWTLTMNPPWRLWSALDAVLLLALGSLPLLLPKTRRGLERLFGFPLGSRKPVEYAKPSRLAPFLGYPAVALLLACLPLTLLFGIVMRESMRVTAGEGPDPIHRSPALRNVYEDWKTEFRVSESERVIPAPRPRVRKKKNIHQPVPEPGQRDTTPDSSAFLEWLQNDTPPELITQTITECGYDKFEEHFTNQKIRIETLEKARTADYFEWPTGERPSHGKLRDAVRTIRLRAYVRIHQNRPEDALHDLETLYHVGRLLYGYDLVTTSIGVVPRRIADQGVYYYWATYRNDPERLTMLAVSIDRVAPMVRRSIDIEGIRRRDPVLWRFSFLPEIAFPGRLRSFPTYYWQWAQFDTLELATALELHRHKRGAFPDKLDALAPEFLPRLPLDPWNGEAYQYENLGDKFSLNSYALSHPSLAPAAKNAGMTPLFPDGPRDNPELRAELDRLRAVGETQGNEPLTDTIN